MAIPKGGSEAKALAKPAGMDAARILKWRLDANPKLPASTRHVMSKLASGDEAAAAWKLLGESEEMVGRVVDRVRSAFEQSQEEILRPSVKDERVDLKTVVKLATDLRRAIKTSSLPGDSAVYFPELKADDQPDVQLEVGWHSLRPGGYFIGYPLAVVDVLDWAIEMARAHANSLPARAITRRRERPGVAAFVRHLAWQFAREFGQEMHSAIANITTAIFDLNEEKPLDSGDIEAILRDRPDEFRAKT